MQNANFNCNPDNQEPQLREHPQNKEMEKMQNNDKTRNSSVSHSNSGLNKNDLTRLPMVIMWKTRVIRNEISG